MKTRMTLFLQKYSVKIYSLTRVRWQLGEEGRTRWKESQAEGSDP